MGENTNNTNNTEMHQEETGSEKLIGLVFVGGALAGAAVKSIGSKIWNKHKEKKALKAAETAEKSEEIVDDVTKETEPETKSKPKK